MESRQRKYVQEMDLRLGSRAARSICNAAGRSAPPLPEDFEYPCGSDLSSLGVVVLHKTTGDIVARLESDGRWRAGGEAVPQVTVYDAIARGAGFKGNLTTRHGTPVRYGWRVDPRHDMPVYRGTELLAFALESTTPWGRWLEHEARIDAWFAVDEHVDGRASSARGTEGASTDGPTAGAADAQPRVSAATSAPAGDSGMVPGGAEPVRYHDDPVVDRAVASVYRALDRLENEVWEAQGALDVLVGTLEYDRARGKR